MTRKIHPSVQRLINAVPFLEEVAKEIEKSIDEIEKTGTAVDAAVFFHDLKEAYTALDDARKLSYHQKDRMDKFIVPSKLNSFGSDKLRIPEVGRSFYVTTKYTASFSDKEAGFEWLRAKGNGDIIQETVNAGMLASLCKNMVLEEGIDPPEEIVKFSSYETTGSAKYTPKEKAV